MMNSRLLRVASDRTNELVGRVGSRLRGLDTRPASAARSIAWDLDRFGISPRKFKSRSLDAAKPMILVSVPKSGTHLFERILCMHVDVRRRLLPTLNDNNVQRWGGLERIVRGLKPGQLLVTHLSHSPERERLFDDVGAAVFFLHRDPRDVAVSSAHYIATESSHNAHKFLAPLATTGERVEAILDGIPGAPLRPLAERFSDFTGWVDSSALSLAFEDLTGANDPDAPRQRIADAYEFAGITCDSEEFASIVSAAASPTSPTFRRGTSGGWVDELPPETITRLEAELAPFLELYRQDG